MIGGSSEPLYMKLQAQIDERTVNVEIIRDGSRVLARFDDREYVLEASQPEPNVYLLKHNGKVHEFFVGKPSDTSPSHTVSSRSGDIDIKLIDPKKLSSSGGADSEAGGLAQIKTMMPGKVVRLIASIGDAVEKGEAVLVVEAMKMQNDLKAPKAGIVKEFRVEEGTTVSAGDILAVIE